ncbi:hypothetical protein [Amycolatopsis coloradensis]|uniref:hypothetical protein n=1 Tax=Amycolatopsis coloradensis TaxID=76021 RepID=UPI003CC917BF
MKASFVCNAVMMAAGNIAIPADAIFHSDRGVQYTSSEYREERTHIPHHISHLRTSPPSYCQIHRRLLNQRRLHSGLDYKKPHEATPST